MTTAPRTAANRQNALKSTGPRTATGKALVAHNAVRHGLLSQHVLLPTEDGAALAALADGLQTQLQPVGAVETLLVDMVIASAWRLRRVLGVEDYLLTTAYSHDRDRHHPGERFATEAHRDTFSKLARYEAHIERTLYKALHELERLQEARRPPPGTVSLAERLLLAMQTAEAAAAATDTASAAD